MISGSCLCGRLRYQLVGEADGMGYCHCHKCRKFTGSAFNPAIWTLNERVKWLAGEHQLARYESSPGIFRCFCARCGSSLMTVAPDHNLASICAGTVDGDPGIEPSLHIHTASIASWHTIVDDLPQYREEP